MGLQNTWDASDTKWLIQFNLIMNFKWQPNMWKYAPYSILTRNFQLIKYHNITHKLKWQKSRVNAVKG